MAKHLTSFAGLPAVAHADFHCQKGCKNGFANGQMAVTHWVLPSARSMAFVEKTWPSASSFNSERLWSDCPLSIWTKGPQGLSTNPSHVFISDSTVFFQLGGVPTAKKNPNTAGVKNWAFSALRIQQKSSTKTNPQSISGNRKYKSRSSKAAMRPQYNWALATP